MIYIHKKIKNPIKDGIEIGEEIKRNVGRASLIIFITSILDEDKLKQVFRGMKQYIPLDNLIGCSTGGTFNGKNYIKEDGVLILAFDEYYKSAVSCEKIDKEAEDVGEEIADKIKTCIRDKYPKLDIDDNFLGFVFFDWDMDSEQEILDVLGRELTIPIIGGTASDDGSFSKFFQIYKGEIVKDCCVFGVIGGKLKFDLIYGHGYEPTDIYARVTKAEGKVVYELDGKPAYQRYLEMLSEYTKLPIDIIEKYFYRDLRRLDFYLMHPLGFMDINGNYITAFLERVEENALVFRRNILEGSFLVLMKTDIEKQVKSIAEELKKAESFENPLIFINECYGREVLKNSMFREFEEDILKYFLNFYKTDKKVEDYMMEDNCIGWLSYGETIAKDLVRFHNNLSFTGVIFELSQNSNINWREELKNFNFEDDEIEVIVNLINKQLTAKDLLHLTNLSQTKLYHILNKLEKEGIIKAVSGKPKLYYIDNIKEILQKTHEKIEHENMVKKIKRKKLLRLL
ncbi:transcriptional regulator, TrmB [Methanocaldococcus sp. FS406-22]|uniref:FIST N-terminal domain-containing protein n=1 Tax=Methanocaldococcus sp. (strain FS406-22) TaxID=644281 RepID=UPI0001BF1086|nr:FIST N-terminal domain-containing protein [Methanocaldococcus sp. FS406-22]ADC69340.1 transcriptional regulator, TrmB [Methanocaldococcus sp. FS406-22]